MATTAQTPPPQKSRPISSLIAPASAAASSPVKGETPTPRPPPAPPAPSPDSDVVYVPSYSRWFSWNDIHECELRFLPEFFDSRSPSKTPRSYMYIRNSIIKHARQNLSSKVTFTEVRKTLVGDVGSIRRVFDFLEAWGLINYTPSALNKPLKWDDSKDSKSSPHTTNTSAASTPDSAAPSGPSSSSASTAGAPPNRDSSRRICSCCKSVCSIACFACDKYDLTLCARCYVRGSYQVGVSSSDFRRVEISEEAAFLSALVGSDVAEAAARAAVSTLTEVEYGASKSSFVSLSRNARQQDAGAVARGDTNINALEKAFVDASTLLEKEELNMERAISRITGVQMKEIQDKIIRFEELDLQIEKEWRQMEQMENLLFIDQLSLLFHKGSTQKRVDRLEDNVKTE
ncbi:hypothetical protein Tsubulata_029410 [Turnera subulata]|uniref:SWIRM domain-containing protein n=1 Tax=Turnera subulata TaxID=218843 RepID=A0A9Q0F8J7_9ROSI|nr:hypothetical protein Tsubulata_029410 [Turnera subulata]